jgi:exosome complex exonuclease DIS3/RRP44
VSLCFLLKFLCPILSNTLRLGIEGLVTFKRDMQFDPESYTITLPSPSGSDVKIAVFDKVVVGITVEADKNTQRGKVKMALLEPVDSQRL